MKEVGDKIKDMLGGQIIYGFIGYVRDLTLFWMIWKATRGF